MFSLISYYYLNYLRKKESLLLKFLLFANIPIKVISIILFVYSRLYYDDYYYISRFRNKNIITYKKYYKRALFYIKIILIFIHPLYNIKRVESSFKEYYFYNGVYWPFHRYINDYLFLIQFVTTFILFFIISLELSRFYNYRTYRMVNYFGISNGYFYAIKSVIHHYGVQFVILLVFFGIFLFSGLIVVAERGFYLYKLN